MTIEAIGTAALIKECTGATAVKAGEELALKMGGQIVENLCPANNQQELQTIEQLTQMNQFRLGENNSPELNNRNVLKQRELEAGNELNKKFEADELKNNLQDLTEDTYEQDSAENQSAANEKTVDSERVQVQNLDEKIESLKEEYINDILEKSEVAETIDVERLRNAKFEPATAVESRLEFSQKKAGLVKEWEKMNGQEWPRYTQDVYSVNGRLIRQAGDSYDAHHLQPLCMGGKNEVSNITPLHAECHYDKQGVHSAENAYAKLEQKLGV